MGLGTRRNSGNFPHSPLISILSFSHKKVGRRTLHPTFIPVYT